MPTVTVDQLQRAVSTVVDARRAVEAKERALVASLDEALKRLGYRVVALPRGARPAGPRSGARRRAAR